MTGQIRRVLVISFHFPPAGGVKTQRALKLVKYLGEFGWQPYVLAPRGETRHAIDQQSLQEIEGLCEIKRALFLDPLRPLYAIRNWFRRRKPQARLQRSAAVRPRTWRRRLLSLLLYPDSSILWLPTALWVGYRLIRRREIDLIVSTSPPFSSHLLARLLSKLTRKPLVVDLRDLWIDNPFVQQPTRLHERLGRRLERGLYQRAAHITCATPRLSELVRQNYKVEAERITVITNGYDPADFAGEKRHDPDRFRIVHGGSLLFQSGRDPMPLTRGMILACERDQRFAAAAELIYFGDMDGDNLFPFKQLVGNSPWREQISYLGSLPHHEAIATIRNASLLLFLGGHEIDSRVNVLTENTETHSIAAKIFEYLAYETPILLVAQDCPTVQLALQTNLGVWCSSYDSERIADHLLDCFVRFHLRKERLSPDRDLIARYSRRQQAGCFANLFTQALIRR